MKKITLSFILMMFLTNVFSQVGTDCSNPYVVTSLPFNITASTDSTSNNYSAICGSDYSSQNDFVLEFTPASDVYIDAVTSNTGLYAGLFITDGCPDVGTCVNSNEADLGNPLLNNILLQSGTTYYFIISNNDPTGLGLIPSIDFTLDITEIHPFDAGITEITGLSSGCSLGSQTISVVVTNFGADSIYNFDIAYNINAGTAVVETITDTVLSGDTYNYTFTASYDFSTTGTYSAAAYTILSSDADNTNDTLYATISSVPTISSFPYEENFDGASSYWFAEGAGSSWELGTPAATLINSAASSPNSWVTNLTGNHNDYEISTLTTPCFNFTLLLNPIIEFDIWTETQDILTSLSFEYSIDDGATWNILSTGASGINWDNPWTGSNGAWVHVSNAVPSLTGTSDVIFRFNLSALSTGYEGVAIDNFKISTCVAPLPSASFTYDVTNDTHVEFTNTSSDATSYNWNFGDLTSDTATNPIHDYLAIDNSYTVLLIASNECFSDTETVVIDIITTNISSFDNQDIVIYPNPAKKYININYQTIGIISIFNANGVELYVSEFKNSKQIDISSFEKGLYFIRIETEEGVLVKKISVR